MTLAEVRSPSSWCDVKPRDKICVIPVFFIFSQNQSTGTFQAHSLPSDMFLGISPGAAPSLLGPKP